VAVIAAAGFKPDAVPATSPAVPAADAGREELLPLEDSRSLLSPPVLAIGDTTLQQQQEQEDQMKTMLVADQECDYEKIEWPGDLRQKQHTKLLSYFCKNKPGSKIGRLESL
jgi:RES domain-containing protein